jgi:cob(I)alamin adenosyltransferase
MGYEAVGKADWIVWLLGTVDAAVVVILVIAIASSFYAVYDAAKARDAILKPAGAL